MEKHPVSFRLSSRGFSMIEALVVLGILSIVGAGTAALLVSQQKTTAQIQKKIEVNSVASEVEMYLSQAETCRNLFQGVSFPLPASVPSLPYTLPANQKISLSNLSYQGSAVAQTGQVRNGIIVNKIEFNQIVDNTLSATAPHRRFILNFVMGFEFPGQGQPALRDKNYRVMVEIDGSNALVSCRVADSDQMALMCSDLGGTYDASQTPPCYIPPTYQ
ncbi:MAG: type II secretion system protein [Bdellovibrio sp.]